MKNWCFWTSNTHTAKETDKNLIKCAKEITNSANNTRRIQMQFLYAVRAAHTHVISFHRNRSDVKDGRKQKQRINPHAKIAREKKSVYKQW